MKTKKTTILFYIFSLIFFFTLRIIKIQEVPSTISHDEIYYPTEAKAISISGRDTSGLWKPSDLKAAHPLYAELPGTIMAPAAYIFPNNPILAAKFTHILLGTLLIFVLAGVSFELTKDHKVAFFTILLAGFNPWLFQFSRMGFDSLFSLFFYFGAIYLFLKLGGYKKLWSLPFFFIGFMQYQGLKVIFVPLVFLTSAYSIFTSKSKSIKKNVPSLIIMAFSLLIFGWYMLGLNTQEAGGRVNDLIFNDSNYNITHVNTQRQQAIESELNKVYSNKLTVISERFVDQYLESFNFSQLFSKGEPLRNPFSVWTHSIFYVLDLALISIGLIYLFSNNKTKKQGFYLLSLILIAPLPSAINATGSWIMFRSSLLFLVLIMIAAMGAKVLFEKLPRWIFIFLTLLYLLFISRFMYQYFYTYPILGTSGQYFSERIIASYIQRNPNQKIVVLAPESRFMFESILTYNNLINKENIELINESIVNQNYKLNNFEVKNKCVPTSTDDFNTTFIASAIIPLCENDEDLSDLRFTQIPSLIDSGGIYKIYNDSLCPLFGLDRFSHITKNVFNVESLDDQVFCKSFVIQN